MCDSKYDVISLVRGIASDTGGVVPISKGKLRVLNIDPYHQQEKGLIPVPTP